MNNNDCPDETIPPVATFHLKRFKNDGLFMEKILKHDEFFLELDFLPYMSDNENPWHKFDDSKVTLRVVEDCVLSHNACLLFYAREGIPRVSTAFDELQILFEANLLKFSSVLENTFREESASHSYVNVGNSNEVSMGGLISSGKYSDFRCDEPQEDVFHSAESSSDDESLIEKIMTSKIAYYKLDFKSG